MNTNGLTQKQIDLAKALIDPAALKREQEAANLKMNYLRITTPGYVTAKTYEH